VLSEHTEFELASPYGLGRVRDEVLGEVALDAADHVVVCGLATCAYNAECVVFHDGGAAYAAEEALLHAALEAKDGDFGRGNFDVDGDFAKGDPWNQDTGDVKQWR
jgi:hypothetical protein